MYVRNRLNGCVYHIAYIFIIIFIFFIDIPVDRDNGKNIQFVTMILLTTGFFLIEIIVGYSTNSISLIADSFHMLTDVIALIISYTALNVSNFNM